MKHDAQCERAAPDAGCGCQARALQPPGPEQQRLWVAKVKKMQEDAQIASQETAGYPEVRMKYKPGPNVGADAAVQFAKDMATALQATKPTQEGFFDEQQAASFERGWKAGQKAERQRLQALLDEFGPDAPLSLIYLADRPMTEDDVARGQQFYAENKDAIDARIRGDR